MRSRVHPLIFRQKKRDNQLTQTRCRKSRELAIRQRQGVITSYSIHYTKLYEGREAYPPPASFTSYSSRFNLFSNHIWRDRITSYNVCYTKLLRIVDYSKWDTALEMTATPISFRVDHYARAVFTTAEGDIRIDEIVTHAHELATAGVFSYSQLIDARKARLKFS